VAFKDLGGNISTELVLLQSLTLQANMRRRCVTHSLMKNAQNDETKESRKICSGYKTQGQFNEDNSEIYES